MNHLFRKLVSLGALTISCASASGQERSLQDFFEQVRKHPARTNAEVEQFLTIGDSLNESSQDSIAKELPMILSCNQDSDARVRMYAAGFLLDIAIRPDGSQLLEPATEDVLKLLTDQNPQLQKDAVTIADFVIRKPGTDNRRYAVALSKALMNSDGPQEVQQEMLVPLLNLQSGGYIDEAATRAVMTFLRRDDLTDDTRVAILHDVGAQGIAPAEVCSELVKYAENPNFHVRVAAIMTFAMAPNGSTFKSALKEPVEKITINTREEPEIKDLAKDALSGKTDLNPNVHPASGTRNVR